MFLILGKRNEMLLKTKHLEKFTHVFLVQRLIWKLFHCVIWQRFTAKIANNSLFRTSKRWRKTSTNCTSWNNIGVQTSMETFFKLRKIYTFTSRATVVQIMLMKNICKDSQAKLTNCFNFHNIISKTNETECFWEKVQSSWFGNKRCFFTVTFLSL